MILGNARSGCVEAHRGQPLRTLPFLLVQHAQQQAHVPAGNDDEGEDAPKPESGSSPQLDSSRSTNDGGKRQYLDVGLGQVTTPFVDVAW